MPFSPVILGLPVADRRRSHAFFREVLGLEAFGAPADDGVPEPLQFALNDGLHLMLIPAGGFGWVIGDRAVAEPDRSECLLSLAVATAAEVDELVDRACRAGAGVVTAPGQQPWGYAGAFADLDGHVWQVTVQP